MNKLKRSSKNWMFVLIGMLWVVTPGAAQAQVAAPRVTLSGAYTLLRTNIGVPGGENEHVLMVSPTVRLTRGDSTGGFALSGRMDYLRGNAPDFQSFQFGVEVRRNLNALLPSSDYFKAEKFEFFGNVLAGAVCTPRANDFAYSIGGGVDFIDTHADVRGGKLTIRAFEAKLVRARGLDGGLRLRNNFVAATGITLRF